ncbi:MAG TPA: GNAT family N-acetyltransferase [Bacteroidota bacterium]|nr:GNAT family N-acetyltransferase [Bacteroidota bacterium]
MRLGTAALISLRPTEADDKGPISDMLENSGAFTAEEIKTALELVDCFLHEPDQKDYELRTSLDEEGRVVGYFCVGPTPLTRATFDLYWIAVNPSNLRRGIGTQLLRHAEELVVNRGGRLLLAETSSRTGYDKTRSFYRKNSYSEVARIRDYYDTGDDLLIYGKYLSSSGM